MATNGYVLHSLDVATEKSDQAILNEEGLFQVEEADTIPPFFWLTADENTVQPETRIRISFEKPSETDLIQQFGEEGAIWIAGLAEWKAMPPFAFTARWDEAQPCPTWSTLVGAAFSWDLLLTTPEETISVRYWKIQSCEIYQEP